MDYWLNIADHIAVLVGVGISAIRLCQIEKNTRQK